jgi:type IV pilus assembly protein PilQ
VPWDQALDIVLQNNGLDKQLSGNVLRIATRDTLKREAETQRDLEKAQTEAVAPVTVTRVLSFAKAGLMTATLKKFLSQRGDILSDERSNQLIIRDIPSVIPVIDNLIRQLDRKSRQVEIEARVVSATRSFAQDIGVQLGFTGTVTSGRSIIGGDTTVGTSTVTQSPIPPPLTNGGTTGLPLQVNLPASAPTSGLFLGHRSPNFAVDFFITAAEAKGVGKLLSKPRVITQNNEKATVKQGTKIPVQTTINNTVSVQFIDAVLKLEVTPQITAEGTVFMDVLVENTQIDPGIPRVQGVPALDTQSAETKVMVADGGTVVIGGIIVTSQRIDVTEVPLLGSLPIIGHLFRRNSVAVSSQELLFFLTPRVIPG